LVDSGATDAGRAAKKPLTAESFATIVVASTIGRFRSMRLRNVTTAVAALIYPPTCVLCGAPGDDGLDLCLGCHQELPVIGPCCPRCALPLPASATAPYGPCGACQQRPPPFSVCHAAFRYEDPLPALVHGLKFRDRFNLIRLLGSLLARALPADAAMRPDAIVPVPLHPRRLRERGYNQSLELAKVVGAARGVPVDPGCCARVRATPPQVALDQKERLRNLRGAFQAREVLSGRHLAILDDVVTTGSTVTELAHALQHAGCRRVDVWTLARTP
jgi:ComF family protein